MKVEFRKENKPDLGGGPHYCTYVDNKYQIGSVSTDEEIARGKYKHILALLKGEMEATEILESEEIPD